MDLFIRSVKKVFFGLILCLIAHSCSTDKGWTPLLDSSLSKWDTYLSYRLPADYHGEVPVDENGDSIPPFGLHQNVSNVFSVSTEHGDPVLRISGEIYGCLFTRNIYDNYHLKLKVKWGDAKWDPRKDKLKDSGVLYHSMGAFGHDYWRSWMLGQELQIMEGHMGDFWSGATTAMDIRAFIPEGAMSAVASEKQPFVSFGAGTGRDGFCMRTCDYENPEDEWTEVELICFEGKSLHIVNHHVVMVLKNSRYMDHGKYVPLTKGKIQLQSEGAEVFYKDIYIKPLKILPDKYKSYFEAADAG